MSKFHVESEVVSKDAEGVVIRERNLVCAEPQDKKRVIIAEVTDFTNMEGARMRANWICNILNNPGVPQESFDILVREKDKLGQLLMAELEKKHV